PALVDELADARNGVVLLDVERQHRIGHGAVRHLLVDAEYVAAPVAARRHLALGGDRNLGAAAVALERAQHGFVGRDVARTRGDDRALELVLSFAEAELLFDALALPLVAAERADEQVGAGLLAHVRRAAPRTVVE